MGYGNAELILMITNFIVLIAIPFVLLYLIGRLRGDNKPISDRETSPFFSSDFIDNQRKILEMIQQGKVGIDDGEKLLSVHPWQ